MDNSNITVELLNQLILAININKTQIKLVKDMQKRVVETENREIQRVQYMRNRVLSEDLKEILNGNANKTKIHLRISVATFKLIVEYIAPKHHGWSVENELVCFLYWMACGCSYRVAGGFMGMSRTTVCYIIHKMLNLFLDMKHIISAGADKDYEDQGRKFCRRAKSAAFSKCIGAIDGTHIRVRCPNDQRDAFINYKGYYSYQVQAVSDADGMFTNVFIGFPGSVHDTRVLHKSSLYLDATYPPPGYCLLGDKGYPCISNPISIITPFKNTRDADEKKFNTAHSRARNVVECAFGILKTRWRNIFNRDLELSTLNCIKTIFAAFVLHNICIMKDDFNPYPVEWLEEEGDSPNNRSGSIGDSTAGIALRSAMLDVFIQETDSSSSDPMPLL